jgi:uncharacterized damage-inducible protein DinB
MATDTRIDPPFTGTENEILASFLTFLRETILYKASGLDDAQLRRPHEPSRLTLLGVVKHLAYVERYWFREVFTGEDVDFPWTEDDPDGDWRVEPGETTEEITALYRREIAEADRIIAKHEPGDLARNAGDRREGLHLRWILVHMIEETGRHAGHMDLIREAIDGQVGE